MLVTTNLTQPCLLGADFINEQKCPIDLNEKVLKIGKEQVPLTQNGGHVQVSCHVAAVQTLRIPGKHQMQVPVYTSDKKLKHLETFGMIEPLGTFVENGHFLVARSLSVCIDGYTSVCVVHLSTAPTTIHSGERVATFSVGSTSVDENREAHAKTPPNTSAVLISVGQFGLKLNLPEDRTQEFTNLIKDFTDIFAHSDNDLGRTSMMKHSIQLKGSAVPIRQYYWQYYCQVPFFQWPTVKCLVDRLNILNRIDMDRRSPLVPIMEALPG